MFASKAITVFLLFALTLQAAALPSLPIEEDEGLPKGSPEGLHRTGCSVPRLVKHSNFCVEPQFFEERVAATPIFMPPVPHGPLAGSARSARCYPRDLMTQICRTWCSARMVPKKMLSSSTRAQVLHDYNHSLCPA